MCIAVLFHALWNVWQGGNSLCLSGMVSSVDGRHSTMHFQPNCAYQVNGSDGCEILWVLFRCIHTNMIQDPDISSALHVSNSEKK
jgi:hypothetical protein